jgi:hypothetical protein
LLGQIGEGAVAVARREARVHGQQAGQITFDRGLVGSDEIQGLLRAIDRRQCHKKPLSGPAYFYNLYRNEKGS